jgi:hypothetical protein
LYGPGGYGKGWLAVAIAVCVAAGLPFAGLRTRQGPVLYLDWEDDEDTFRERVHMICAGLSVPVDPDTLPLDYRRCERPLPDDVDELSRLIDTVGYVLLVVDSVEMASTAGDHENFNDRATRMRRTLRLLHCSHLLIDHVSDAGRRDKDLVGKPINGVMKVNLARNMWEIKREQEIGAQDSHVGLYQTKTNHTGRLAPLGFHLDFHQPDAVRIVREDPRQTPGLASPLGAAWRIQGYLATTGAATIAQIAEELELPEKTVETTLARGQKQGRFVVVVPGQRGKEAAQWGASA